MNLTPENKSQSEKPWCKMRPRDLNEIDLDRAINELFAGKPGAFITMSPGQWDGILASAYDHDFTLLVVENEIPIKAYRKAQ